jgi:hypothetical protein
MAAPDAGSAPFKKRCVWARLHDSLDEFRQAIAGCVPSYNPNG